MANVRKRMQTRLRSSVFFCSSTTKHSSWVLSTHHVPGYALTFPFLPLLAALRGAMTCPPHDHQHDHLFTCMDVCVCARAVLFKYLICSRLNSSAGLLFRCIKRFQTDYEGWTSQMLTPGSCHSPLTASIHSECSVQSFTG